MKQTVYKFDKIKQQLQHEIKGNVFEVADYFQYYTTGIEDIANDNMFFITERYDLERSEVIAYNFYEDENLSDVILALNNDVYWWDIVPDNETRFNIIENKIHLLESLNKQPFNYQQKEYYREKINKELDEEYNYQRLIVVPKYPDINRVIRKIKRYLDNRKVW